MARVIKQGTGELPKAATDRELTQVSEPRRSPIIDRDTYEARAEAQQIRERAQQQADALLADAQAQAQGIVDAAEAQAVALRAAAVAEGEAAGRDTGAAELTALVAAGGHRLARIEAQVVDQVTTLALHIARKVLGRELEFHPEAVVQIVRQALNEKARQRREITLRLHPEDAQVVREQRGALLEVLSRSKELGILEDPEVARYGVRIETDAGTIDAQLETQLAAIERALAAADSH